MKPDFDRARDELKKPASERRGELLRSIGWTTLKGRGARARRLRAAPLDLGEGMGHPFAAPRHRPPAAIPGRTILVFLVVTQYWLKHLRQDCPGARARRAHLMSAPRWMWKAYVEAEAALDADDAKWTRAMLRLPRALVAAQLEIDVRTVRRLEGDYFLDWGAAKKA